MNDKANVNVILCPILSNGNPLGDKFTVSIDTGNLSKSIGKILEDNKSGTEFRILGSTVKIPSGSFSGQFNAIVKKLVELSFVGCDVKDEPKTKDGKSIIAGLKGKLHFENPTMLQVNDALKIRVTNYNDAAKWERNKVRMIKENVILIEQSKVYKTVNKLAKEGGRAAVLNYIAENKGQKLITLSKEG